MRWILSLSACVIMAAASGCQTSDPDLKPRGTLNASHRAVNEALVESARLQSTDAAIIRQHTLYPYHFVQYGSDLNDLGKRDVHILARHYQNNPGPLNVNQGDAPASLYQARVQTVKDAMVMNGVAANRLTIADEMPGGEGLPSDWVVIVLDRMKAGELSGASAPRAAYISPESPASTAGSGSTMNSDSSQKP